MAAITTSTEIARPVEEVFAYVTDPSTMPEWQQGAVSGHMDAPTTRIGSNCTTIRKIGGREREVTTEITQYDPPHRTIALRESDRQEPAAVVLQRCWIVAVRELCPVPLQGGRRPKRDRRPR